METHMVRQVINSYQQLNSYQPRIAVIEDDSPQASRKICDLIKKAGGKPMVIPRHLSDRLLASQKLSKQQIAQIRRAKSADEVREFDQQIASATRLHLQYIARKLTFVDSVVLPGSIYDIPPSAYHETNTHSRTRLAPPIDVRFQTELMMADYALNTRKIPLLGISGGMQLIVVKTGGKLVQHIEEYDNFASQVLQDVKLNGISKNGAALVLEKLGSKERELASKLSPNFKVVQGASIIGVMLDSEKFDDISCRRLGVIHTNHQAVAPEGVNQSELAITALTQDGRYVEAVEHKHHPFCLGVQFHPEYSDEIGLKMLREMVEYSRKLKAKQFDHKAKVAFYVDIANPAIAASMAPGQPSAQLEHRIQ
jgi:putative glutamine amidotransferase